MGRNSRGPGNGRGWGSAGYVADRKLIPRIKEYIRENDGHLLEADEVATALQAEYSEYSRKKKAAFKNCVAKALKLVRDGSGEGVQKEEGKLQRLERRHLDANWKRGEEGDMEGQRSGSDEDLLIDVGFEEEEEEEGVCEEQNMMNNSLLQVYRESTVNASPDVTNWNQDSTVSDSHSGSQEDLFWNEMESTRASTPNGGEPGETRVPLIVGERGAPIGVIDTVPTVTSGALLSNITVHDSHVTTCDSHVTAGESHMMGTRTFGKVHPVMSSTDAIESSGSVCSGASWEGLREGREEVGRGSEERRKLKKVTFAPDVVDKQSVSVLKSPCAPRKRRHAVLEEGGMTSGHKKHRSHREHRTHHSKLGKHGKREKGEAGETREGGEGEMMTSVKRKLKEKHMKSQFKLEKPSVAFADVGGCQAAIKEVTKLLLHVRHPEIFAQLGIRPPRGFLLHGPPGCGKTLLASAIAGEMGLPIIRIVATEIVSGVSGESESTLRDLFTFVKGSVPCVLFIDEVDVICTKRETAQREMEKRIVSQLLACVDDLHDSEEGGRVLLMAATTQPDSLDPAVRRSGRFDREICLGIPDESARLSILQVMTRSLCLEKEFSFSDIAHYTPGFVGADLRALIREASLCAVNRLLSQPASQADSHTSFAAVGGASGASKVPCLREGPIVPPAPTDPTVPPAGEPNESNCVGGLESVCVTVQDFQLALQDVQPSAKREGFATVPDTTWEDVGALEDIREELSLAILAPVQYPEQFASLGLTTPPGILLVGPPGCGKTLLAKAVANESGINFISVRGPELLNMYVGESERAVRLVFQRARNSTPCVIFFDELDALCPKRSEMAETSASARVVNQLLTEMDGLQARKQVFIMAATNRPDIIDPAVLRPGRLDKLLHVGLPCAQDRATILNTITKNGTCPRLDPTVDVSVLASPSHTEGFSGADLKALVREAAVAALKDYMKLKTSHWVSTDQSHCATSLLPAATAMERSKVDIGTDCTVTMTHFLSALDKVGPSVSEKDRLFYERMRGQFSKSTRKK